MENKGGFIPRNAEWIAKIMMENENFLFSKVRETYDEIVELINDAIKHYSFFAKKETWREDRNKFSIVNYIYHILFPFSYAILTDLLAANLPACFMELRLMVESLVKCYYADLKYPSQTFFQEKVRLLEKEMDKQKKRTSKLLREYGGKAVALWGRLSGEWLHIKGFVDRIVEETISKSDMPAWSLIVPINYNDTDLEKLEEIREYVSKFRELLKSVIEDWKKKVFRIKNCKKR